MISVAQALGLISEQITPLETEEVPLSEAHLRVLRADVTAKVSHPSTPVSAMDGYALRAQDITTTPVDLTLIGESPAGSGFDGNVNAGEAVRIFTGAPVPDGADSIVIQENTRQMDGAVRILERVKKGAYIRPQGLDFKKGDTGLEAGIRLSSRNIALAAAMNVPNVHVARRPRVAYLTTGNEVLPAGSDLKPGQLANSNGPGLHAFIQALGGEPVNLGTATDDADCLKKMLEQARQADLIVTTGGVSVGDYDLVKATLEEIGFTTHFWKVAMRPGKPTLFGKLGDTPLIGLPGNPVSVMVGASVFLKPAMDALGGVTAAAPLLSARLDGELSENDQRQDYIRARITRGEDGTYSAAPFPRQDSAMLTILSKAQGLIVRAPDAPAAKNGERIEFLPLAESF